MSRLGTLKASLEEKQAKFNRKLSEYSSDTKSANEQPLNDKRNGCSTMECWDRQNDTLSKIQKKIEKTQATIEREESRIGCIDRNRSSMPEEIQKLINDDTLKQWGRYPHIMFVEGVDKAYVVWDDRKKVMIHKFVSPTADTEQKKKFARVYNSLNASISEETGKQGKKQQKDIVEKQELENNREFKAAKELEHALNSYGWNEKRFAPVITTPHRILQQALFRSMVEVIEIMGSKEYGYDLRNKASREICKKIVESGVLEDKRISFI